MRKAKVGDYRRQLALARAAWTTRLQSLAYEEVPGVGSGLITFESALTFLAGPNGVGKSTLAKCLYAALSGDRHLLLGDARTAKGRIAVDAIVDSIEVNRVVDFEDYNGDANPFPKEVVYIDSARATMGLQDEFRKFAKIDELINGVAVKELSGTELAAVSRIICRDYRFVHLYEVELGVPRPFFEVGYGAGSYNSATMGDGELAALMIWWHFWRAEPNSIIVLEEPETFLSSMCQKNLCEFIMSIVVSKRLTCVVSSHSAYFIENVASDGLRFLARSDGGVRVLDGYPPPILLKSIGVKFPPLVQIFVEDTAAKEFCRALLERYNPGLSRGAGISASGGDGEIIVDLRKFSELELNLRGIGVFDGDIASATIPAGSLSLPGEKAVEIMLRESVASNVQKFIDLSGRSDAGVILNSLEGQDHHDWLEELAKELGLDKGRAFALLFRVWIDDETNATAGADFVAALSQAVREPPA